MHLIQPVLPIALENISDVSEASGSNKWDLHVQLTNGIILYCSYPEALDLARQLRLACGVEMGSEE